MTGWQRGKSRLRRGCFGAVWLYAVTMLIFLVARLLVGERLWLVEVGNSLLPPMLLPVFVLIPALLILKRPRPVLMMLPVLVFMVVQYAPLFLRSEIAVPADAPRIRVVTFNLGSYVQDYPRMIAVIRSAQANIVMVQEMLTPSADELTRALSDLYPYHALHPVDTFAGGVGIFSQYPIIDDIYFDRLSLGGQRTRIQFTDNQAVTIVNAHPPAPRAYSGWTTAVRSAEISMLLDIAAQETNPLLLAGDFNITDMTDDYGRIAAKYGDAFRAAGTGFGPTFPNPGKFWRPLRIIPPLIRIDYVFYSAAWTALDACPLPEGGSDHYPFFAELALNRPSP